MFLQSHQSNRWTVLWLCTNKWAGQEVLSFILTKSIILTTTPLLHSLMELQLRKWLQQAGVTCSNPKHHLTPDQCASLRNKLLWGSELVE